jgi:hypothetical protein
LPEIRGGLYVLRVTDSTGSSPDEPDSDPEFEAQFARLVEEVEEGRRSTVGEPPARNATLADKRRDQTPSTADAANGRGRDSSARRVWPRNLAIAGIVGALTIAVVKVLPNGSPAASTLPTAGGVSAPASSGAADAGASPSTDASANAGTDASGSASANATAVAAGDAVSQIPVSQLFPESVRGTGGAMYTLVTAGPLNSCSNSDMVAPTLAGLFAQSNGCVGGEGALYKDAANDEFNMTVFTLTDPGDTISILTDLSMDPEDFEVGALQPPAGSGLAALSATSGIIQQFAGTGHYLGVFMAQWSDGRASDYATLQKLLDPLQDAVTAKMKDADAS